MRTTGAAHPPSGAALASAEGAASTSDAPTASRPREGALISRGELALHGAEAARGAAVSAAASEAELLSRAQALAGRTLGELAASLGVRIPTEARRAKGLAGRLLELALGATAGSKSAPDFEVLGVELKTIPLDRAGRPRESTFVTSIDLQAIAETSWEESSVWRKLRRVLWVPIEHDPRLPLAERRIGSAFLWSPSPDELAIVRADWEALGELLATGRLDQLDARLGEALQVRPKAADSRARTIAPDEDGGLQWSLPRGFYLRARFTASIVAQRG